MNGIINLVKNLQTGEIKLLRHFYRFQKDNDYKKRSTLFENAVKLKNCKNIDSVEEKILSILYDKGEKYEKSYEKLKTRLKTDILNILLLQESSVKFRSKYEMAAFQCRRLILQGDVLLGRGVYCEGANALKKASAIAHKNELYTEQLLIDNLCTSHNILKEEESEYIHYSKKIKTTTSLMEKSLFAKYFHDELMACSLFKTNVTQPVEEWKNKLDQIKRDYESSGSVKIGFYYNFSALHFYRYIREYEKSLEFGLILLKQSEQYELFNTPSYSSNINMELAKCFLLVEQYDNAMRHANISINSFNNNTLNILASLEILFYCTINKQDYKAAGDIVEKAFSNSYLKSNDFLLSKWWFLRAGIEFKTRDFAKALTCLKKCNQLFKDKTGWMIACNLFEALCRIESGNLEWFEYRLDGMKKMMQRYNNGKTSSQNKRFTLIFNVLKTLHKNNYDYALTLAVEKENIKLLAEGTGSYGWNLAGFEPIRFDEWIKEKAEIAAKSKKNKSKLVA